MTLHFAFIGTRSLCGVSGSSMNLRWIGRHFHLAIVLMTLFGCRECLDGIAAMRRVDG